MTISEIMTLEEVSQILRKYSKEEHKIEEILTEQLSQSARVLKNSETDIKHTHVASDEAAKRNKQLLKDFELIKGTLRSKAIYTPTEIQWEDVCKNYRETPSLPVATWKCHLPVFV